MRRLAVLPLLLATILALPGCDSGSDAVGVTGTWEGVVYRAEIPDAPRYPITIRMRDTGVQITGQGFVEDLPDGRFDFVIYDGSFLDGNLTLDIQYDRVPFLGTVAGVLTNEDPGEFRGTFDGAGDARGSFIIELTSR
ncbi:hypothetical protein B1759_10010 [Rubrivirga sp. SAORIC476]|uniref:hypothetical protein n=1 Tax=Rubrivirga sp. SAORIC476 TaxID=1961794 RepID=UPI000BA9933C|nr:hypothetical protein [Rubrivirga sp. SAORIC476]MAQ94878.1 hypothetical protein [Rhodothermaceae bacterium]MBC13047.1 hypothetical protein [Rhodothermaceae bacterium]PAP81630.1 hypothetical protein B1759_10010 [Rubrivirga sp. SAORIC476]